jgi:galactokinase
VIEDRPILDRARLVEELRQAFPGASGEIRVVRAPGRVNLMGEHTDYNAGFVLPVAIGLETWMAVASGEAGEDDRSVELLRLDSGDRGSFALDRIPPTGSDDWIDYVAGVAWSLQREGVPLRGLRGVIASTLPISSGLSSSAAIELASAWSLSATVPPPLDPMDLARAAQRAENEYVGVASGLMDQFASALGRRGAALRLDCRSLEYHEVPLPLATHVLVVCDTGSPRRLEHSEYNKRRQECEQGVALLARHQPGISSLRDVEEPLLERYRSDLDDVVYRRCLHVVRENARVEAFEQALRAGDLPECGRLLAECHASLRDLYEVSSPELDAMVEIVRSVPGVVGVRMTGAGFGGCTVALVTREAVESVEETVQRQYPVRTGLPPRVWAVEPVDGAGLVA